MASMSSTVRRRAWINSSRQQPTVDELDPEVNLPSASIVDDDVFSDGCFTGKIENWLLGCGSEASETSQLSFESAIKAKNFDDDLSLGADASLLNDGEIASEASVTEHRPSKQRPSRLTSTPRQQLCLPSLNLGHSMASSCLSSSTCRTTSSISEVLQLCAEDAEETLYELGFGCDEPQVTVRIPPRFFNFPSLSQGINFRLFLDSQLRRIREEDPSLSLASRFRQVQVLTAMANAFYSLYSHVSRTPLQKLATPEFTFSSSPVERFERFRSSVRSEPRSPVERLKDTVSKMCLYTGSPRGSDSSSPQPSPHRSSSLPDVVDIVLEKVKSGASKKLELGEYDSPSVMDVRLVTDGDTSCDSVKEEQQAVADTDVLQNGNKMCHKDSTQTDDDDADENSGLENRTHSVRTSLASSLSGETVIETARHFISTQSDTRTADLKPVVKVTYDLICPQIVESVHQLPFCSQHTPKKTFPPISSETESISGSCSVSHQAEAQTAASERNTQCCITVTGWEEDDVSSCLSNTSDSSHTSTVLPLQICEESRKEGKSQFLNPQTHQGPGKNSSNLQQVNSFELEEVHSAGEDDFGQSESSRTSSLLSKKHQHRGEVVRDDSMQSDSSGYADEEVSLSSKTQSR